MTDKPRIFSGMQPSADSLHIGNYIGALLQWRAMQDDYDAIFCIVDLHAHHRAAGPEGAARGDPPHSRRSTSPPASTPRGRRCSCSRTCPRTPQLAWILNGITGFGEAEPDDAVQGQVRRGTGADASSVGLFTYPVLMAADILLYDTELVPVGDDQKQHVELTRDLAAAVQRAVREDVRGAEAA